MQLTKSFLFIFFLSGFCVTMMHAQNAIPATGGNVTGSNGTVSYSIGQVVYTTITAASGRVSHGVQQPFEISIITEVEGADDITLILTAYPNPASDFLTLKVENYTNEKLLYKLFDENGKILSGEKVIGNEILISMKNLLPSIYFLKITDNQKIVKTFKIIKN